MAILSVIPKGTSTPVEVEILEYFVSGKVHYACVEALEGKPFTGGNKWPIWTSFSIVPVADLDIEPDECTCTPLGEIACPACVAANKARYGDDFPFQRVAK